MISEQPTSQAARPTEASPTKTAELSAPPTIHADNITVVRRGAALLRGASFQSATRSVALLGETHWLIAALLGEASVTEGTLRLGGSLIQPERNLGVHLVPKQGLLLPGESARTSLLFGAELFTAQGQLPLVQQLLERMGLTHLSKRSSAQLDPAELRALSVAAAWLGRPHCLVLENPLDDLDELRASWLIQQLDLLDYFFKEINSNNPAYNPPSLVWTAERFNTPAQRRFADQGDMAWLRFGHLLSAGPARSILDQNYYLVRVLGAGEQLREQLAREGLPLKILNEGMSPHQSSFMVEAGARAAVVRAAASTQTPLIELLPIGSSLG